MEKTLVIIISKDGGTTRRKLIGDTDLEKDERRFVYRDIEEAARKAEII